MRLLITAGPTREAIDEVRYISNRSSGCVGVAIAQAAATAGHNVTLLLGPGVADPAIVTGSEKRGSIDVDHFVSCEDLQKLLLRHFSQHDVLVMAAAVCDYRPVSAVIGKMARGKKDLTLEMQSTPDLVAQCAAEKRSHQLVIAFALEEESQLEHRAREKMSRKKVDAIVANPLATMEHDQITPTLITYDSAIRPGAMSKADFGTWLITQIEQMQHHPR